MLEWSSQNLNRNSAKKSSRTGLSEQPKYLRVEPEDRKIYKRNIEKPHLQLYSLIIIEKIDGYSKTCKNQNHICFVGSRQRPTVANCYEFSPKFLLAPLN